MAAETKGGAETQQGATLWTRRDLLTRSGWGFLSLAGGIGAVSSLRLLFPRVSFAPPTQVVLDVPARFAVGEVSERWKASHRLVLVREELGFFALRAVCTHLGCIPAWVAAQRHFRCPCHGSGFERTGENFEGPAPRALERLKIGLDEDGQIVVDTAVSYRAERGEWKAPGAFLPLAAGRRA